jgi:hypothetical protein
VECLKVDKPQYQKKERGEGKEGERERGREGGNNRVNKKIPFGDRAVQSLWDFVSGENDSHQVPSTGQDDCTFFTMGKNVWLLLNF